MFTSSFIVVGAHYEELIRKMKVLSLSQGAFLKVRLVFDTSKVFYIDQIYLRLFRFILNIFQNMFLSGICSLEVIIWCFIGTTIFGLAEHKGESKRP